MEVKENFSSKSLPRYLCLVAHFRHQGGLWYVCRNLFLLPRRQESLADSTHPPYSCKSQKKALVLCLRTLFVTWLRRQGCWFEENLCVTFLHGESLQSEGQLWGPSCPCWALDVWHGIPAAGPGWRCKIVDHRLHISHFWWICPHSNICK